MQNKQLRTKNTQYTLSIYFFRNYISGLLLCLCITSVWSQDEVKLLLQEPLEYEWSAIGRTVKGRETYNIVAISPDGKWMATSSKKQIIIWDMNSKTPIQKLPWKLATQCLKMVFLPDNNFLVGVWRVTEINYIRADLMVWDWQNKHLIKQVPLRPLAEMRLHEDHIHLACSKDGSKILLSIEADIGYNRDFFVNVWETSSWELVFEKKYPIDRFPDYNLKNSKLRLRISPDNNHFTIGLISTSSSPITSNRNKLVPTFIEIWNVSSGKKEKSFIPLKNWKNYRLLDYSFSPSGEYIHAVYIPHSTDRDSLFYCAVRWDVKSGKLVSEDTSGDFYSKIKLYNAHLYTESHQLSEDGRYFYTPYEGILDLQISKPVENIFKLNSEKYYEHYYDKYPVEGIPVPGTPTTILDRKSHNTIPYLVDFLTGEKEYFPSPETDHHFIRQLMFGKDGQLILRGFSSYSSIASTKQYYDSPYDYQWLDLSILTGDQDKVEGDHIKETTGNSVIELVDIRTISHNWVEIEEKNSNQSYLLNINNKKLLHSDIAYTVDAVSSSGKWVTANGDIFKLDEDIGKYIKTGSFAGDYQRIASQQFTHKEDFLYYDDKGDIYSCKLPACEAPRKLNINCDKFWFSPDERWLVLDQDSYIEIFDRQAEKVIHSFPYYARDMKFTPDGQHILIAWANRIELISVTDFQPVDTLTSDLPTITAFDIDPRGKRIAIAGPRKVEIRDLSTHQLIVTFVDLPNDQYLFYTPDHYYAISKGHENNIAFQKGDQYFTFEHFDLHYNRPDIIMERLGYASPTYIQSLKKAYQKRLEKFGIKETAIKPGLQLPIVSITNKAQLPFQSKSAIVSLDIEAVDQTYPLSRLLISVNEVPLVDLQAKNDPELAAKNFIRSFDLKFTTPKNMVEVQVWNNQGVSSLRTRHFIRIEKNALTDKPDLYLAAIGVSKYQDEQMNLRFAAKDAQDILKLFTDRKGAFRNIYTFQLLDTEVTRENIQSMKPQLQRARAEDRVILFVAGHGLLDNNLDFYFGTHDVDFKNPSERGISFTELEELIGNLNARQKILLMDACNSGELDKASSTLEIIKHNTKEGTVSFRSFGETRIREKGMRYNSFATMKDLFVDLRRKSGTIIISAASGAEAAIEGGQIANGVFTYTVLEGMGAGKESTLLADENENGQLMISELQNYVLSRVPELTKGKQRPTSRVEYLYNDFVLWDVKGAKGTEDIFWREIDLASLKQYVNRGGNINSKDENGASLLMKVINNSTNPELAQWLVDQGANPHLKGTIPIYTKGERTGYYGNLTCIAAAQGKLGMLRFLIEDCHISVNDREYDAEDQAETGWTALQWAANNGQLEIAKYLISKGAEPNVSDIPGESTPLILAATSGNLEVVKMLVAAGARTEIANQSGYTALLRAARNGHPEVVKYLIEQGASLNHQENDGWTALMLAGVNKHYYCFDHLLQAGADINLTNKEGKTLDELAQEYGLLAVQELVLYKKINRPFFAAIKQKDKKGVRSFLENGASLDVQDAYGASMFMHIVSEFDTLDFIKEVREKYKPDLTFRGVIWSNKIGEGYYGNLQCIAAGQGKIEVLKYFIENLKLPVDEPEYNFEDHALTGWTALQWAANQRNNQCIEYLIRQEANPNIGISTGETPALLYCATSANKEKEFDKWIAEQLITEKNTHSKNRHGWTLWHYYARDGRTGGDDIAELYDYTDTGEALNAKTNDGWTPLMLAAYNDHRNILKTLEVGDNKPDPNLTDNEGKTALMHAVEQGHYSMCISLVRDYGADCTIKNENGETALDIARRKGHTNIVAMLSNHCK